jgi:hypothetical protein
LIQANGTIAVFVVGPPGVGKTTMMRSVFSSLDSFGSAFLSPNPKWTVCAEQFAAAGHYTGNTFDGADTVPYTGAMKALESLENNLPLWRPKFVFFDGDRFSYVAAAERVKQTMPIRVALLNGSTSLLQARRAARGTKQNETWLAGRATKAARFAATFPSQDRLALDATASPFCLADALLGFARASR